MLLDLLFTPRCIGCQRIGVHLCDSCIASIHSQTFELTTPSLTVHSAGTYEGWLRDAVVRYKSGSRSDVFGLASLAAPMFPRRSRIISVPSTSEKIRERGYDTVGLLVKQIVRSRRDIEHVPVLRTNRPVRDQVGLSAKERQINVAGAFRCAHPISGDFVVFDDVVTTGSTVKECARALSAAGAHRVFVFSLCASGIRG